MRAPALYALLPFAAGILIAVSVAVPSLAFLGVAVFATAAALAYAVVDRPLLSRAALCLALIAAAGFLTRLQLSDFPNNHISHFTALGDRARIVGVVADEPDIRPAKTFLVVAAESLVYRQRAIGVCGKIRVRIQESTAALNYLDRVTFAGFIGAPPAARNPGAFDYHSYLAARGIHAVCYLDSDDRLELLASGDSDPFIRSLVAPVREYIVAVYERYLSREQSALLRGFLIGDVRFIPPEVHARFKDTGTLHVLAASGSNVGYVLFTIFLILRPLRLPKPYRYLPAIVAVVIFSFLAYNQPSVVRASVMAIVALVGMSLRRDNNWLNSASIAGLIVLSFRPLYLFDLGTQLSFAAAFALILFMPAFQQWLPQGKSLPVKLLRYFLILVIGSIVAQLSVMPILLHNFHSVPIVSFLANIVVVPLVGLIATLGILLIFLSPIAWIASLLGTTLAAILGLLESLLAFFDSLPIPQLQLGALQPATVLVYYCGLLLIMSILTRRQQASIFLWLLLLSANVGLWSSVIAGKGSATRITILDTYRIPTIVVETPERGTTLINAGGVDSHYDSGESIVLPFLRFRGIHSLNQIIATSTAGGNLESINSVMAGLNPDHSNHSTFSELSSPVIRLEFDSLKILLLTQPIPVQYLNSIAEPLDILGLDWRMLDIPETSELLRRCRPRTVLILDYFNRYGGGKTLESFRLQHPDAQVFSTLESGAIELIVENGRHSVLAKSNS